MAVSCTVTCALALGTGSTLILRKCIVVTEVGISAALAGAPSITNLDLSGCFELPDSLFATLPQRLRRLRTLDLSESRNLTSNTVITILHTCVLLAPKVALFASSLLCFHRISKRNPRTACQCIQQRTSY